MPVCYVQDELKYTGTDRILHRSCIHSLHQKAAAEERHHLYLDGPAGCGKSIAVASLVNWARTQGWLVCTPQCVLCWHSVSFLLIDKDMPVLLQHENMIRRCLVQQC